MKKLNNKGFTLIELLAVIVILAVVMGIAANSVISSMNKARAGALGDTALVIANGFNQKYTESMVDNSQSDVYGDVLGAGKGYDFSGGTNKVYQIVKNLGNTFNISNDNYVLFDSTTKPAALTVSSDTVVERSIVIFNATTGKFVVCMFAKNTGSNFVAGNSVASDTAFGSLLTKTTDTTYKDMKVKSGSMVACSDGTKTWK